MKMQLKATNQKGFTIIELVVVILLLGILAATALPRFLDVTDEAHQSVVDGVRGGLTTGSALFRATWVAQGQPTATAVTSFGDGSLFANSAGYPYGDTAGTPTVDTCVEIYNGLLQSGRPTVATAEFSATAATLEGNIEAAATATDIVAVPNVDNANITTATACTYYYVGQFKSGNAATPRTIQTITYTFAGTTAGTVTEGTLVLTN